MSAEWQAFFRWQAGPQGHHIPVLSGWGEMQGKIKGRGTVVRERPICTWGWRGTLRVAAPCRMYRPCRASLGQSACIPRHSRMALDGASP